jgi:hypothetical protein
MTVFMNSYPLDDPPEPSRRLEPYCDPAYKFAESISAALPENDITWLRTAQVLVALVPLLTVPLDDDELPFELPHALTSPAKTARVAILEVFSSLVEI